MLTEQYPSSSEGELNSCERQPQTQYKQEKKNMKKYRIRKATSVSIKKKERKVGKGDENALAERFCKSIRSDGKVCRQ